MTLTIRVGTVDDIPEILRSAEALVATDAGRYDASATNLDWAMRTGLAYCNALLANNDNLILLASDGDEVLGHLVARLSGPGSVHPIRVAELESIHVYADHRGLGVGDRLVSAFLGWATDKGAQRVSVTAYAANDGAQRFYRRHGFLSRSIVLDRDLSPAGTAGGTTAG